MKRKSTEGPSRVNTHPSIARGKDWIFYVRHDARGKWSFLPKNHLKAKARCIVPFVILLTFDKTISSIVDLPRGWHAWRQYPDAKWEKSSIPTGPMIFARYNCIPGEKHPDIERVGETFVNCWLRVRSFAEAKKSAEKNIRCQHWKILNLDEIWRIPKGHYQAEDDGLPYYEQALLDKEVYVFHQSPKHPVYCVHFKAVPMCANTQFPQGTFADVKYWVVNEKVSSSDVFDDFWGKKKHVSKAISLGRKKIQSEKWRVTDVLEGQPVNYRSFIKDPLLTQYYEEAEEYGECIAFWTDTKPSKAAPSLRRA